jgi:hypothetical protein
MITPQGESPTSRDVIFGHITSGSHATSGYEQWYILYYYNSEKKSAGMHFQACAEHSPVLISLPVTLLHVTSFPVSSSSSDVTSNNECVMVSPPLLPPKYALSCLDILLSYLDLGGDPIHIP